jgi:hypothetical protein
MSMETSNKIIIVGLLGGKVQRQNNISVSKSLEWPCASRARCGDPG